MQKKKTTKRVMKSRSASPAKQPAPSKPNKAPEAGDLEGIRGNRLVQSEEVLEEMFSQINSLKGLGFNDTLIRDVVLASELQEVLGTDALISKLVQRCETVLAENQNAWSECLDPGTPEMRKIHTEAKAANMVVQWVREIFIAGQIAENTMSFDEENHHE